MRTATIAKAGTSEDQITAIKTKVESILQAHQGTLGNFEDWGTRRLSFGIQKESRGRYIYFGFTGNKATTEVGKLSGGERARLALALITREAPHLLILDEPTNHLDVDAREALVQALSGFDGAVLIVSHDRHMLKLTADRLVLVDGGTARDFDGSMDDYVAFILGKSAANDDAKGASARPKDAKLARQEAAKAREAQAVLRKSAKEALVASYGAVVAAN